MSLSVGNFQEFLQKRKVRLDLENAKAHFDDGTDKPISLDQWPLLLFLNGLGFSDIHLFEPSPQDLEKWLLRLNDLEQTYIHDPESLDQEAIIWGAYDDQGQEIIRCDRSIKDKPERLFSVNSTIPPLAAPLNMPSDLVARFAQELRQEGPLHLLRRFVVIVKEFLGVETPEPIAEKLIMRAIRLSCEWEQLELAVDLIRSQPRLWEKILQQDDRVFEILQLLDPKPQDLLTWSQLFHGLQAESIVSLCLKARGHATENRALKLLHYRCLRQPADFFDCALKGDFMTKRLLLPSLYPSWTANHYPSIWQKVRDSLQSEDCLEDWLQVLLHLDEPQALRDITTYFFSSRLFSKRPKAEQQMDIIRILLRYSPKALLSAWPKLMKGIIRGHRHKAQTLMDGYLKRGHR